MAIEFIFPDWPAPVQVNSAVTTRKGGISQPPFDGFNLAEHVEDDSVTVKKNRALLKQALNLPSEPVWLEQVHGVRVINAGMETDRRADASFTDKKNTVCCVMTADCLPVLFCDRSGSKVAAAHAGWRGLADGVLEATVQAMGIPAAELMAWMGPAIGPSVFEISDDVREVFVQQNARAESAFKPTRPGHWLADLYELGRQRLNTTGLTNVYGGGECTYSDSKRFFSYRRDGKTGRIASLIWME